MDHDVIDHLGGEAFGAQPWHEAGEDVVESWSAAVGPQVGLAREVAAEQKLAAEAGGDHAGDQFDHPAVGTVLGARGAVVDDVGAAAGDLLVVAEVGQPVQVPDEDGRRGHPSVAE